MKQLIQNLKSGKMELLEVPFPALSNGYILVRNYYSLISAGTEAGKVKTARSSMYSKAKQKPEQVKQVLDSVKTEGLGATYQKVMNKLDAPSPLGYSSAGEIMDVASDITGFKVGDMVACGGASAVHAEVIAVPKNLCVKVPASVDMQSASFATIASIALQGIRQADLRLGESCAVIGLGLIGQLTVQMLKASGIKVAGIDIDNKMVALADQSGADISLNRNDTRLLSQIQEMSNGYGVDAVIISAGTSSKDPVELAGQLCRRKGKVVIVGAVPTGFSRPNYYKKELDLRMSCSYGPGRYDDNYEEKGLDYPIGYVRWTENRNMQAFLDLVSQGKLNIALLTTHQYDFEKALDAYNLIMQKEEIFAGIVLKYNTNKKLERNVLLDANVVLKPNSPGVGFIGAGSFAQKYLLPNVPKKVAMIGVVTAEGNNSRNVADKYSFKYASGNADDIFNDAKINIVFIATRHNTHAKYVLDALKNGKNIFVEKPLCMNEIELEEIKTAYLATPKASRPQVMVGFNRRFAPFIDATRKLLGAKNKKGINYRINVGKIPADHWTQDKDIGGGRIIGEVCHFLDLAMYISGSKPISLSAFAMDDALNLQDTLSINLRFQNGSVATISYFANGNKALSKEYLEIHSNGTSVIIDDFSKITIYANGKKEKKTTQDKGHAKEVEQFIRAIENGKYIPITFEESYLSTLMSFKVLESIRTRKTIYFE